jgi:hypothetical protein
MKKFGIILLAVLFVSSFALASPPVPPPPEQSLIETQTDIVCVGTVIETQSYNNTYVHNGTLVSPAGTSDQFIDAYLDALEDADPLGFHNAPGTDTDVLPGGDPDTPYIFGEWPIYGTVAGSDGQSWREIAGYPGAVGLNATLANPPTRAFELAGGIGSEADFSGPDIDDGLGRGDSIAEISYDQDFQAVNGTTELRKSFKATDADTPNLEVSKDFAYLANPQSNIASAEMDERVAMTIVSYGASSIAGAITGAAALCPWVQPNGSEQGIPATNELIAGGSAFDVVAIVGETDTAVTTTAIPSFNYSIQAAGPADTGGVGVGDISAAFAVQIQEGDGPYIPPTTRRVYVDAKGNTVDANFADASFQEAVIEGRIVPVTVTLPGTGIPNLAKFEQYEELASASGVWTFSKTMSYNSILPDTGAPTAGALVDQILP